MENEVILSIVMVLLFVVGLELDQLFSRKYGENYKYFWRRK